MQTLLLITAVSSGVACALRALTFPKHPVSEADGYAWYDVDGNGRPDFALLAGADGRTQSLCYDDNEDGRVDRVYRLEDYADDQVPHLIILLDSIPFAAVAERYAAEDFRWCNPPQKVISPFPTLTEVCCTELLRAPPRQGIIDSYYDPRAGRTRAGILERTRGAEQPWERRLNYHSRYWEQGLAYLDPRPWHAGEMRRVWETLERSPTRVTLVYVTSASGMLCKYGSDGLRQVLDDVRQLCLQVLYERQDAVKISILADHGHNLVPSRNIRLDRMIREAGFRPASRVEDDEDVVLEINGLVSYAGLHTRRPAVLAEALVRHPEIELAMHMDAEAVIVRSAGGCARTEFKDGLFAYRPVDADILDYQPVLDALAATGKLTADGFGSADDWFAATLDHNWPDAPRRIWRAFHGCVVNSPAVMLSIRDGWCAGLSGLEKFITMASTHGGLNQVNSATFVMSMTHRANRPMRTEDVMAALEPDCVQPLRR